MKLLRYRAHLSVGLTLFAALALWLAAAGYIADKSAVADEILQGVEPRHARLLGLRNAAGDIAGALGQASATIGRQAYPASQALDRVGPDVQQRLRAAAEAAGVSLAGSQIATPTVVDGVDVVAVSLTLEADAGQLQALLDAVQGQQPALYLDSLELQPAPRNAAGRLAVRARFSALRLQR